GEVEVTLEAPAEGAVIYYTLDGSEPFNANWLVAPGAQLYTGSFTVPKGTELTTRVRDTNTYWLWSSPVGGQLTLAAPATAETLRLSELHYHPADPTAAEFAALPDVADNEFEFIELTNVSSEWVALAGLRFVSGIEFSFEDSPITQLAPGTSLVLVSNRQA